MQRCVFCIWLVVMGGGAMADVDISFQSPSGNIRCAMSRDADFAVRCDLEVDRQSYTNRPASCEGEWGTSFGLRQTGAGALICVTDADAAPAGQIVLPYGSRAILDGIICQSERSGVTCSNLEGGGFSVRRAEQRVF